MKLYLVQHARAMPKAEDPKRPLTPEGRAEAERIARVLEPLELKIDQLWHSGKLRAEQTAAIYANALKVANGPAARKGLAPNDNVAPLRNELAGATGDIMIVGHVPFVSKLAALLLTGCESPPVVAFVNAGVVCLDRTEDDRWQVAWIITPELLPE